jgi:hypothetical protein
VLGPFAVAGEAAAVSRILQSPGGTLIEIFATTCWLF